MPDPIDLASLRAGIAAALASRTPRPDIDTRPACPACGGPFSVARRTWPDGGTTVIHAIRFCPRCE